MRNIRKAVTIAGRLADFATTAMTTARRAETYARYQIVGSPVRRPHPLIRSTSTDGSANTHSNRARTAKAIATLFLAPNLGLFNFVATFSAKTPQCNLFWPATA